jgi:hypothetical protein
MITSALLPLADDPGHLALGWTGLVLVGVLVLAQVVLFVAALISILASPRYTGGGKFLWIVVVFAFTLLGPLGWFIAGRRAAIRTNVP